MTVSHRRLSAAAVVLPLALAAGCGTAATPGAGSGTTSGGASPAAGSPSAGTSPSTATGGTVDIQQVFGPMIAAEKAQKTATLKLVMGAGAQSMTETGVVEMGGTSPKMDVTMAVGNQKMHLIVLDQVMYLGGQPGSGGKYTKIDKHTPGLGSMVSSMGNMDPNTSLRALESSATSAKAAGQQTIDGVQCTHYVISVDTKKMLTAQLKSMGNDPTLKASMQQALKRLPATLTEDIWVGTDHLPRQIKTTVGRPMTMTMTKWGQPVKIVAPPASQVVTR